LDSDYKYYGDCDTCYDYFCDDNLVIVNVEYIIINHQYMLLIHLIDY